MSRLRLAVLPLLFVVTACATAPAMKPEDCGVAADDASSPLPKTIGDVKPWGDPPGETFEARASFTVTIEKLDKPAAAGETFGVFFAGTATAQSGDHLYAALLKYAKFRSEKHGHPGWVKDSYSDNVVVIRCDPRAPWGYVNGVVEAALAAGMHRTAIVPRDAFPASDYAEMKDAQGKATRPILTALSGHMTDWGLPGAVPSIPREQLTIYALAHDKNTGFSVAIGARRRKDLPGRTTTLEAISPELASSDTDKGKAKSARESFVAGIAKAIDEHLAETDAKVEIVEIVGIGPDERGRPRAAEIGFAFALIDAMKTVNAKRGAAGKTEFQEYLKEPQFLPPEPQPIPEEEVVYPPEEQPKDDGIEETPEDGPGK